MQVKLLPWFSGRPVPQLVHVVTYLLAHLVGVGLWLGLLAVLLRALPVPGQVCVQLPGEEHKPRLQDTFLRETAVLEAERPRCEFRSLWADSPPPGRFVLASSLHGHLSFLTGRPADLRLQHQAQKQRPLCAV